MDLQHWLTLGDVLREHARSYPQRTAVVDGEVRLTWPELDARVDELAGALLAVGAGEGERVLWLGQNSFRVLELLLACSRAGAIFCPVNWRQSADELAFVLDDLTPRLVVWQETEVGDTVRAAREQAGDGEARWVQHDADGAGSYEELLHAGEPGRTPADHPPGTSVLLLYTAAFSGRPNGALLSHIACLAQSQLMANLQRIDSGYTYLNSGPLFHVATFMTTLATFHCGGTNVFTPRVDAEELCRLIEAERCTGAFVVGPTIKEITDLNEDGHYDLSSLRTFGGGRRWNEMITVDDSPWGRQPAGFGQTEVMGMLTLNCWGGEATGTSGRPTPWVQVRIVDPDGVEVPHGETGEIVARGLTVMDGYFNRPEENARRLEGGWHHTNDLGKREHDGSITFVGPKTRLIKSAAENIYPAEVEGCLRQHEAVADVAVIGVPDPEWDQSVKAIVVLKEGESTTEDDLVAHCRERIASYKKPRTVAFVDALPREGWAVDYDALDAEHGGGGYPGSS